jgi:anti-sigma B factor antagonist
MTTVPDAVSEPSPARDVVPEPFDVEIRPDRGRVFVVPHGELELATVDRLAAEIDDLVAAGFDAIVLDLRRLSFLDSAGLCLIVRQVRRGDATLRIIDGGRPIARLFDVCGLRDRLPFLEPFELRLRP